LETPTGTRARSLRFWNQPVAAHQQLLVSVEKRAARQVLVFVGQGRHQIVRGQAARQQNLGVEFHADGTLGSPGHFGRAHTLGGFQDGLDLVHQHAAHFHGVVDAADAQDQHGNGGRVKLLHAGQLQSRVVLGKGALGFLHGLKHVQRARAQIGARLELDRHRADPFGRGRGQVDEAGYGGYGVLDGLGNLRFPGLPG
jgi:hypothetical protein